MHISGKHYNIGHPQKYVGAVLHNAYQAREDSHSPKVKLPPEYMDNAIFNYPVDSCVRAYWDWTTDYKDKPEVAEHFIYLSEETIPFCTDPGQPYLPSEFTLGLADVKDWPQWPREVSWVLDPKEYPKPAHPGPDLAGPCTETNSQKRKWRKKHRHRKKPELKVTNHSEGRDSPVWSHGGTSTSTGTGSGSESSSDPNSGFSLTQKKQGDKATRSVVQCDRSGGSQDWTPALSLAALHRLDEMDFDDRPLSDHSDCEASDDDQEMATADELPGADEGNRDAEPADAGIGGDGAGCQTEDPTGTQDSAVPSTSNQSPDPTGPSTGTLASAIEAWALSLPALALTMAQIQEASGDDPSNTNEEKAKGVMWGLHAASRTLSEGYQWACLDVQGLVRQSLALSTEKDCKFVASASLSRCAGPS